MKVIVLGAGVVGVATAYYLARAGHEVVVVDRRDGVGLETSFANGGQISANHTTPWATPGTPRKALRWLGRTDAPLLFHLRFDPALFAWLARFLANCTNERMRANIRRAMRLALYSRRELIALREREGLEYDQVSRGILHVFRSQKDLDEALPQVELMNRMGCVRHVIDVDECLGIEPALSPVRDGLVGGIYSPDDESGDAYKFTSALAKLSEGLGATFRLGTAVGAIVAEGGRIAGVQTGAGRITADACVVAAGSYSPLLLKPVGVRLPVYPAKGYSVTIPIEGDGSGAPTVSLIDDEVKMVYSRLGNRLRAAGTAEFAGYDDGVDEPRARFLLAKAMSLFPHCGDPAKAEFWAGLRPATPDGSPVIGRTRYPNLFLNTGHGTLGWTMACGSGRIVADIVSGVEPEMAVDDLAIDRFG
ncbi:MAG TPA: D-amino acid dehydrogenase [Rhodospirillales bacterium]|nr:D-amino acid dehydrogenase [Rhodospirillales bacterium]